MFKTALIDALRTAVNKRQSGLSDDEAVAKAAEAHDFNPAQTTRLLESYNTAKTAFLLSDGGDRSSLFSIADPEKVAALRGQAKAASAFEPVPPLDAILDYSAYETPVPLAHRAYEDFGTDKVAAAHDPLEGCSEDTLIRHAQASIAALHKSAEHIDELQSLLAHDTAGTVCSLAHAMEGGEHKLAHEMLAYIDSTYIEKVAEYIRERLGTRLGTKLGQPDLPARYLVTLEDDSPALTADLDKVAQAGLLHYATEEAHGATAADILKHAEDLTRQLESSLGIAPPDPLNDLFGNDYKLADYKGQSPAESADVDKYPDLMTQVVNEAPAYVAGQAKGPLNQAASAVSGALGGAIDTKSILQDSAGRRKQQQQSALEGSRQRLANLQRQLMLEKLFTKDPILSGHDPEQLLGTYQVIQEVAPSVSLDPEIVRAVLRTAAQSEAVSPYDAKGLADLEAIVRKTLGGQVKQTITTESH